MKRYLLIIASMMLMGVSSAQAGGVYAGLGVAAFAVDYTEPGLSINQKTVGGTLKLGWDYNEYIGAEFRFGAAGQGSTLIGAVNVELGVDAVLAAFLKLQYPVAEDFNIYGLAGATSVKFSRKVTNTLTNAVVLNDSARKTAVSFGAGGEYMVSDKASVAVEWVNYWSNEDISNGLGIKASVWSLGASINYYF